MFQFEEGLPSVGPYETRVTMTSDWNRGHPSPSRSYPNDERTCRREERTYPNVERSYPSEERSYASSVERARRPLPPRPIDVTLPTKTTVPLKVWIIASASCFAVCAALVLATVAITKWGTTDNYTSQQIYSLPEPVLSLPESQKPLSSASKNTIESNASLNSDELKTDLKLPILEKISTLKKMVTNRKITNDNKKTDIVNSITTPQLHPFHDTALHYQDKKIKKKEKAVYPNYPLNLSFEETQTEPMLSLPEPQKPLSSASKESTESDVSLNSDELESEIKFPILEKISMFKNMVANREKNKRTETKKTDIVNLVTKPQIHPIHDTMLHHPDKKIKKKEKAVYPNYPINLRVEETRTVTESAIPNFKPTLPEIVFNRKDLTFIGLRGPNKVDNEYEEYYNDENLYDDYMQSNTMTSYLIEKVQELHDWIVTDPELNINANVTKKENSGNEFGTLLKALNESLIEGNVTIIMNKLKDIYFGENYTRENHTRKVLLSNSTDLLSFGILTLDVMLLHNIQIMAWENQEAARTKMLKDPDVFAFNALFLEPNKVEARQNEVSQDHENIPLSKRPNLRSDNTDDFDIGKTLIENVLEMGMSTARAAIHLGRAYKNTKNVLTQLSNRDSLNTNIQNQISRNIDANTHALEHLQTSFSNSSVTNVTNGVYTELDCVWLLYCKNLIATSKLNAPYGTMARINGMALRMLAGELAADRALDTMLYEALTGWTELRCADMFPRCSKVDAASVVLQSILTPVRKSQTVTRS